MKDRKIILISSLLAIILLVGCNRKEADINILATTDLHSIVPEEMVNYVEDERQMDENLTVVDAGDFFDIKDPKMNRWFFGVKFLVAGADKLVPEREGEPPIVKNMSKLGYDAVVLGNHEFEANNKSKLDSLVSYYEKNNMPILSANTYKMDGKSYVRPYVIKEINTEYGNIKLGILGLTIKEVGDSGDESLELKDQPGYRNELYMTDLVEDAKKWTKIMKEKEHADIIVAVAHTGEKPKKPKHPGNRIQDLARNVDGIDAIVAGHTHVAFAQHDYKNKNGDEVIVTQPGKHGECISKINFKVKKNDGKWEIIDKSSDIIEFK